MDGHCTRHYLSQQGGELAFYRGQRGKGWFGNLFRGLTPLLKRAGTYLGNKAISTTSKLASDIASGQNFKESLKRRGREVGQDIQDDLIKKVQSGSGFKKTYKRRKTNKKQHKIRRDIFQR